MVKNRKSIKRFAFPNPIEQVEHHDVLLLFTYGCTEALTSTEILRKPIRRKREQEEDGKRYSSVRWRRPGEVLKSFLWLFCLQTCKKSFVSRTQWMTLSHGRHIYMYWNDIEVKAEFVTSCKKKSTKKELSEEEEKGEMRSNSNTICKLPSHK